MKFSFNSGLLLLVAVAGFLTFFFVGTLPAQAQMPPLGCPGGKIWDFSEKKCKCPGGYEEIGTKCRLENPGKNYLLDERDFGNLIKKIVDTFLYLAGAIAVFFLIWGGFKYIASRGNEEAIESAKKTVTGAIIGIIIIVMAFAIVAIVNNLLTSQQT